MPRLDDLTSHEDNEGRGPLLSLEQLATSTPEGAQLDHDHARVLLSDHKPRSNVLISAAIRTRE